jgi:hypothetical protein
MVGMGVELSNSEEDPHEIHNLDGQPELQGIEAELEAAVDWWWLDSGGNTPNTTSWGISNPEGIARSYSGYSSGRYRLEYSRVASLRSRSATSRSSLP